MDRTREFKQNDIDENKGISVFAYFGILCFAPLLAAGDSPYARFHANQGFVLFIDQLILLAGAIVSYMLSPLLPNVLPAVFFILLMVWSLGSIFMVAFGVIGALQGKARELPLIGHMNVLK